MGKGNPIKSITKPVEKAVKNVVGSPIKGVNAALKGDIMGVANAAVNAASLGTASINDGSGVLVDGANIIGGLTGANALKDSLEASAAAQAAQEKAAADALAKQQADAKAAAISRRRADLAGDTKTVFTTALGDVGGSAAGKTKKKTVLGG